VKVPLSVREIFESGYPLYLRLKEKVDQRFKSRLRSRWHYESRVKQVESFAQKLETGRVHDVHNLEDFFACTIVAENPNAVTEAEGFVAELFPGVSKRKPPVSNVTFNEPWSFQFEDLRLYVEWCDDPAQPKTDLEGVRFEVQIKTYLQHAWGIATHDLIYKGDTVGWPAARIAFQVKAMLEHAELTIAAAKSLATQPSLEKANRNTIQLQEVIEWLKQTWSRELLPTDTSRLATNVSTLLRALQIKFEDMATMMKEETECGRGAKLLNISPFGSILQSIVQKRGPKSLNALTKQRSDKYKVLVPREIEIPVASEKIEQRILRCGELRRQP
jgi:ppGpp synthetase/RelA/SpoT-type nucleotidyltranferase